jgi:hypothetical protein
MRRLTGERAGKRYSARVSITQLNRIGYKIYSARNKLFRRGRSFLSSSGVGSYTFTNAEYTCAARRMSLASLNQREDIARGLRNCSRS